MGQTPRLGLRAAESTTVVPLEPRPPSGAPNVVAIVLDDTGFAQLGCFGSDISTPHMDGLASGGLRYNRFHVTSLCSPTRASFLTGRNHHAVGMGFLADIPMAYPGYTARIPKTAATLPRILRDAGYGTLAVGKWHLVPRNHRSAAGPFDYWPLGLGFERYYGFLQGDANQWAPNLVSDNHYVDPPRSPHDGYHLSEDLVDRAIRGVLDQHHAAPDKPFFLYLAFGAMHAPHHVPPQWVEPYRGRYDEGWESWREGVFGRQLDGGVVPQGTALTPRPPWVPEWSALPADERRMHARMQEVFAGFLTHTDAQVGRLISFLDQIGKLDNTLVLLFSDNGASAEGGIKGSVNEHRFTARVPESVEDNLAALDDWGGFSTYNHYSWGWAWAGNTPLRLWKRYTWLGGTRTPLIVHWPAGMGASGEVRRQLAHVIDLYPTVLDACGVPVPDEVDGARQLPVDGSSLRDTFDDAEAPDPRTTQYFEMFGSRSIIHGGWKATTDHVSQGILDEEAVMTGSRNFDEDHWSLFDLQEDFSESTDRSSERPEVVRRLQEQWLIEAGRNLVVPIDDSLIGRFTAMIPPLYPPGTRRSFRPGGGPIHDEVIPFLVGGFRATADVDVPVDGAGGGADGVLFAMGDWNGGYALFVDEGRLVFCAANPAFTTEVRGEEPVPGGPQLLSVVFTPTGQGGEFTLRHGTELVGSAPVPWPLSIALQHGGALLRIGYDTWFPVSRRYEPPATWRGTIREVVFETPALGSDPLEEIRAALHSD